MEKQVMEIEKRLKEIAFLLWNNGYTGKVCFDHKSYDDENDIPRIKIRGQIIKVAEFAIERDGNIIYIVDDEGSFYSLLVSWATDDCNDTYYESIGLFDLLREVYYETKESWEIGDYELDFINTNRLLQ